MSHHRHEGGDDWDLELTYFQLQVLLLWCQEAFKFHKWKWRLIALPSPAAADAMHSIYSRAHPRLSVTLAVARAPGDTRFGMAADR
jgi:hypothetical protein